LGFILIGVALLVFLPRPPEGMREKIDAANAVLQAEAEAAPYRTIAWYKANDAKGEIKATSEDYAKTIDKWLQQPHGWKHNPLEAFDVSENK